MTQHDDLVLWLYDYLVDHLPPVPALHGGHWPDGYGDFSDYIEEGILQNGLDGFPVIQLNTTSDFDAALASRGIHRKHLRACARARMEQAEKPAKPIARLAERTLEYPVADGFIDLAAFFSVPILGWSNKTMTYLVDWHRPDAKRPVRGHIDLSGAVFFEVKPDIKDLGALIRQLRRYQAHRPLGLVVVSPDTRHRGIIEEQGFGFLEPQIGQASLF